jgi:hypothetical protein
MNAFHASQNNENTNSIRKPSEIRDRLAQPSMQKNEIQGKQTAMAERGYNSRKQQMRKGRAVQVMG